MVESTFFASSQGDYRESSLLDADPLRGEHNDGDEENGADEDRTVLGAGVATGAVALLLGGPVLAVMLGFGAAYAAAHEPGAVGDSARAMGVIARTAQNQFRTVNARHHLVEKSRVLVQKAWRKARAFDREHGVVEKTVEVVRYGWQATTSFCRRHRVVERGLQGATRTVQWVAAQLDQNDADHETSDGRAGNRTVSKGGRPQPASTMRP